MKRILTDSNTSLIFSEIETNNEVSYQILEWVGGDGFPTIAGDIVTIPFMLCNACVFVVVARHGLP
ncbi:MAG: hypothetical protein KKA07_16935 [Bacteroidetes bacterium]|nr:hypothetical protein [Bacteroidota bacterium]